ncbi:GntR family transcriptional regulator [Paenibacillus sp. HJGM_3]|uniref:GntR family transcriptional regulator n=1 Tax=Paenibacillus sp. HJGM_3 TaxID=3379816 RepID=UPI00385E9FAC
MSQQLDRTTPVPLYYQLYQILENEITNGSRKPGDYFGTELELQEQYDVSRATIRKALERLEANGYVNRITGKGIFIAAVRLRIDLPELLSFSEEMKRRGMQPGTRLLGAEAVEAPVAVVQALQLADGCEVLQLRRIRLGDGQPIVYSDSYVPLAIGLTPEDDFSGSLYERIHEACGRYVDEAAHSIEAAVADAELAEHLHVEAGFPLLAFRRTGYDATGAPIVYERGFARADQYSYEIKLKRSVRS